MRRFFGTVFSTAAVVACLALVLVWTTAASTRAADCPALPPPYAGPLFDANVQAWHPEVDGLIDAARAAGVKRIALFANSKTGAQSDTAKAVADLAREHPDLIVLGAPKIGFIRAGDLPRGFVAETVAGVSKGTYHFVGEILYTHGDKPDHPPTPRGEVFVDPTAPGTKQLLTQLAPFNVPFLTHWEAWAWDRDRARFDKLYDAWPQQRFVLPSLAYGSADKAESILSAHPNLWGIVSRLVNGRYKFVDPAKAAKLGPNMLDECGVLSPDWRAVLIKHSDRLLFGTDFYASESGDWDPYQRVVGPYRRLAGQLPPDVAARISWDNAAALYGAK
jgi:hypothetical protein